MQIKLFLMCFETTQLSCYPIVEIQSQEPRYRDDRPFFVEITELSVVEIGGPFASELGNVKKYSSKKK